MDAGAILKVERGKGAIAPRTIVDVVRALEAAGIRFGDDGSVRLATAGVQ